MSDSTRRNLALRDSAPLERQETADPISNHLKKLFAPYPQLLDLLLCIYEQSKLSPKKQAAFESGVRIAKVRDTDKDLSGIGISIDDILFKQIFTGGESGRLDVLINNCKSKLDRWCKGDWTPTITREHIVSTFNRADENERGWDYELVGILQFMRMAYTTRTIQEAAERMYEAKQQKARTALGLPDGARLPSNVFMKFREVDSYTQQEVRAVISGQLDPKALDIKGPASASQSPQQIEDMLRAALGDHFDDPDWNS